MTPSSYPSQPAADRTTSTRSPTASRLPSLADSDLRDETKSTSPATDAPSPPHDTAGDGDGDDFDLNPDAESGPPFGPPSRSGPSVPMQQRRRVTRACDECRRKKIKCDGKQPCTHCQVYSYECTYDKPSNRRRNPAPQYIEALENKLSRAETLLRKFMPDVDLNDPNLDPQVQQEFRMREQARLKAAAAQKEQAKSGTSDGQLQSMISSAGQLDLNETGDYDFHGTSSGSVFFKQMKKHFRTLLGRDYQIPFMPRPPRASGVTTLDSPRPTPSSPWATTPGPSMQNLPAKERAIALCSESLDNATCLLRIVHKPTFYSMLDGLYEKPSDQFGIEDKRNLALAYAAMALGCMYNVSDHSATKTPAYKESIDEALNFYSSARFFLQDITECRDLTSLQALLFMILFLQSISNLSTCYGFVGIALRSALRMGLHRHLPHVKLDPIESETRRRVFYICRQMDTYVSALLGFPLLLNDDDIDQLLPTAVDDQFITKDGITTPPPHTPSSYIEAFNAHVKLMDLLSKVVRNVYPLKRSDPKVAEGDESQYASYMVSYARIKEMEEELQQWKDRLPYAWRPNPEGPVEVVRIRNLLRFAYAHVQMVLYRPFLHYVSPRFCASKDISERAYGCGATYITVARNIIHIGTEMRKQVSLVGPYWFTLFSEFFAIISLVFFVLENQDKPGSKEILADAIAGKNMIGELAAKSMVADRISSALENLFEQLPVALKESEAPGIQSKKRPRSGLKLESNPSARRTHSPTSSQNVSRAPSLSKAISAKIQKRSPAPISHSSSMGNEHMMSPSFDPTFGPFQFSPSAMTVASPGSVEAASLGDAGHAKAQHSTTGAAQQIHRLDAIMFPSDDPLAYPHQPRADIGINGSTLHHSSPGEILQHDSSPYYVPQLYDGIEGQLLGPLPPYLMQAQGDPGIPFPAQMYSDPMLPSQQLYSSHQPPTQGLQLGPEQLRQQSSEYDHMLASASWQGFFQQPRMG
ncbi:hypothetical protein F4777DRAFT_416198 [Nemania sp. FL0916]|nr:hypothetical protein F4777DRAFT_416198 [Nemania sp. FL0916]